jgi:hypothetical protein
MKKLTFAWMHLASIGSLALFSTSARADFFIHSWDDHRTAPQQFDLGADAIWYRTTSNFDSTGSTFSPTGLQAYDRYLLDLSVAYGITSQLSIYGRLELEISKVDSSSTVALTGSGYGPGDQTVGLNYRILEKPHSVALDLQTQIDFPAYTVTAVSTTANDPTLAPNLGDGSVDVTGGAFLTYILAEKATNSVKFVGGAGYTYRTSSFSAAVPWNAQIALQPRREGFVAQAGAFGIQSLNTDSHPNNSTLLNTSSGSLGTGGSYVTNAINPSHATLRGLVGWRTGDDFELTGTVAQSIWGHEAPNGLTLALGFQTHFGGEKDTGPQDPALQSTIKYGRANRGYVNYDGLEAKVLRANDRFQLIKIDKGLDNGVQMGDTFDIFMTNADGSVGSAVARGRVTSAKGNEAAIKIEEYFKEVWIEEGFTARRPIKE